MCEIMSDNNISYKQAIAEIESILEKLEKEELDVDELTQKVQRASFLLSLCKNKLSITEKEIKNIIDEMEK
jgi:exodeoxyribonuclease VII small subunit